MLPLSALRRRAKAGTHPLPKPCATCSGTSRFRSAIVRWICTAQSTAWITLEFREDAVARRVDDPPSESRHKRQHDRLVALEIADGGDFVLAHQPRIPGDIGRRDRSLPAAHREFSHGPPGVPGPLLHAHPPMDFARSARRRVGKAVPVGQALRRTLRELATARRWKGPTPLVQNAAHCAREGRLAALPIRTQ